MPDNNSDEDLEVRPFPSLPTYPTNSLTTQELLPSMKPVVLDAVVLNVYIKFDKDKRVETLIKQLQEPYPHLPKGPDGKHVSILHQYALESTRDSIDMSNQSERLVYRPNFIIRKNDAFGPWVFNYLLSLLALDYQYDFDGESHFPPVWKTNAQTQVHVVVKNIQSEATTSKSTANSTIVSAQKEDITLEDFLRAICQHNQRDEKIVTSWLTALREESIATVEHLHSAVSNERCWDNMQSLKYIVKQMIRDYVQLNDSSNKSQETHSIYRDSDAALIGDIHRIRRYFHYITKTEQYISYLDSEAVEKAIYEIRKIYDDDGNVLHNILQYLKTFCIKNEKVGAEAYEKRRQEWIAEQKRLVKEVEKLCYEISIVKQEAKGSEADVGLCQQRLAKVKKEKLELETSNVEFSKINALFRRKDKSKEKIDQAKKNVQTVQAQLEVAQMRLEFLTKPVRLKENKIAENKEKIQSLATFLNVDPEDVQKKLHVKYGRGLLLYGPPGTGKSELLKRAAIFAGITMTTTALASGELNRPYVGETERLLIDIMSRANTIPYLICAITIDEIDGLVPKRTNSAQQHKVDGISVLLSHIEGVKNIPNLIVLGATNRKNMMDEAFLRRMQSKCFVGRPSPHIRRIMLEPLLYLDNNIFNDKRIEFLVKVTTNFSGAAVRALVSSIVVALDSYGQSDVPDKLLLDLADNAAREFNCWLGAETLPEICRSRSYIFSSNDQQEKYSLKFPNCFPSGRILIDLTRKKYHIEFKNEPTIENDFDEEDTLTITFLLRLIHGCLSRNIDTIQLIDLNFLNKNNAFDDTSKLELLTSIFDECDEYNRSMLVFDIDSLVMVSVTDSAMSESNSISNTQLYQFIREKCKRADVDQDTTDENSCKSITSSKEKWIVMIVKREYLRDLLVEEIDFKKTLLQSQQEREDEQNRLENETVKLCPKCLKFYTPAEVIHGSCLYHDAYVVDLDSENIKLTQHQANEKWQKAELEALVKANNNHSEKIKMPLLYWACCLNNFKSGQTCKTGTCGLPEELKESTIDPDADLIALVQKHFQKNSKAESNIKKFVQYYEAVKGQTDSSVRNLATTNRQVQQSVFADRSTIKKNTFFH